MNALTLLQEMVAIRSVNPFRHYTIGNGAELVPGTSLDPAIRSVGPGNEEAMNDYVEARLRAAGFDVERQLLHPEISLLADGKETTIPARWNVLGVKRPNGRPSGKSILFFGHTDTVDVKHGWESDPFSITTRVVDGRERWYALGANDMKGGLAAILAAVSTAVSAEHTVKVAFVVDEEYYSFGAQRLVESSFLDDVVLAVAPEIGDGRKSSEEQWIGLGRLGRTEYEFEVIGKACHGADAFVREDAINAVHESAILAAALVEHCKNSRRIFSKHGVEALNAAYVSSFQGGDAILSVPDRARIVLDRTFLPEESPERELATLVELTRSLQDSQRIHPKAHISVRERARPTPACIPYFFSPETPIVKDVVEIVRRHAPEVTFGIGRSVADENRIARRGIPTVILGPTGEGSHTSQEWVDPATVTRLAEIFRDLITRW